MRRWLNASLFAPFESWDEIFAGAALGLPRQGQRLDRGDRLALPSACMPTESLADLAPAQLIDDDSLEESNRFPIESIVELMESA